MKFDLLERYRSMKIAIAGTGYVGLSNAVLLAQNNTVYAVDVIKEKVDLINQGKSPIVDPEIEEYLAVMNINLILLRQQMLEWHIRVLIILSYLRQLIMIQRRTTLIHLRLNLLLI